MTDTQEFLISQIRIALDRAGVSQAEVARSLRLSTKHVNQMLTGRATLTLGWAEKILALCGQRMDIKVISAVPGKGINVSDEGYVIEKGNIYESADPRDDGRRIRVTSFYTGYAQANIVSHPSGKNHRSINARSLHADRNTRNGKPRKNGYFFVGKHEEATEVTV